MSKKNKARIYKDDDRSQKVDLMDFVTTENCLMIKVNQHKNNYDGSICDNPRKNNCGATENFRSYSCALGRPNCFDMNLFNNQEPSFYKLSKDIDNDEFASDVTNLVNAGKHPIIFFYAFSGHRKVLVGLYVVKSVLKTQGGIHSSEFVFTPIEGWGLRFPEPRIENDFLWNHSEGTNSICHRINRNYVVTALGILVDDFIEHSKRIDLDKEIQNQRQMVIDKLRILLDKLGGEGEAVSIPEESHGIILSSSKQGSNDSEGRVRPIGAADVQDNNITLETNPTIPIKVEEQNYRKLEKVLQDVQQKSRSVGLYYSNDLIKRYHISLATKPFVILAGISGGGKTQLVLQYAAATGSELLTIAVRPDWTSNESLLGVYNILSKSYIPTPFTEFLLMAQNEWLMAEKEQRSAKQFMVLLDEMNLARVEYYLSDFLSKMELPPDQRLIRLYDHLDEDPRIPREVLIPPNLSITGTVNIDETTYTFSGKVLDRSNFIKLEEIDFKSMSVYFDRWVPPILNNNVAFGVVNYLSRINNILFGADQQFGYRTASEVIRWVDFAVSSGAFDFITALDYQIKQKILVKIQVTRSRTAERDMVAQLMGFFEDEKDPNTSEPVFGESYKYMEKLSNRIKEDEFALGQM